MGGRIASRRKTDGGDYADKDRQQAYHKPEVSHKGIRQQVR